MSAKASGWQPAAKKSLLPASGLILLSSATGGMSGDIFQLYVVDTLGYSPSLISLVAVCMIISVPLQLMAPRLIDRVGHRRAMIYGALTLIPALLIVFAGGVAIAQSRLLAAVCLVTGATLAEVGISISFGAAWSAWYAEFTDARQRPLFLSMLSFVAQGTVIVAFIVQTVVFDGEVTEVFYRGVLLYCLAYLFGSIIVYRQLPDPTETEPSGSAVVPGRWGELVRNADYRIILFGSAAQFLIGVPLLAVYALTVLDVPAAAIGVILIVRSVASLLCAPVGGWLIGRIGTTSALRIFGTALFVQMLAWTVLPKVGGGHWAVAAFAVFVVTFQVSKATFALALATVEFEVIRPDHRVRAFTLIDIVSSSAMQINVAVGALLVAASLTGVIVDTSFIRLDVVKILTAVGSVIALYLMVQYRRMGSRCAALQGEALAVESEGACRD